MRNNAEAKAKSFWPEAPGFWCARRRGQRSFCRCFPACRRPPGSTALHAGCRGRRGPDAARRLGAYFAARGRASARRALQRLPLCVMPGGGTIRMRRAGRRAAGMRPRALAARVSRKRRNTADACAAECRAVKRRGIFRFPAARAAQNKKGAFHSRAPKGTGTYGK